MTNGSRAVVITVRGHEIIVDLIPVGDDHAMQDQQAGKQDIAQNPDGENCGHGTHLHATLVLIRFPNQKGCVPHCTDLELCYASASRRPRLHKMECSWRSRGEVSGNEWPKRSVWSVPACFNLWLVFLSGTHLRLLGWPEDRLIQVELGNAYELLPQTIQIDSVHRAAIREELGHRLSQYLKNKIPENPPRLKLLLDQFRQPDREEAPSIAPSFEDMDPSKRL
jgi:hypothetical protein